MRLDPPALHARTAPRLQHSLDTIGICHVISFACREFIADLETPVSTFLKVRAHGRASRSATSKYCFLLESVEGGERLARYSFVGASPYEVLSVGNGPGYQHSGDPLIPLEAIMSKHKILNVPSVKLPPFTGGAVGYVSYDCVRHFEPKTSMAFEHQEDTLQIPEACFMLCDTLVIFDHVRHTIKIVAHARIPEGCSFLQDDGATPSFELSDSYAAACERIEILYARLNQPIPADDVTPMPATLPQPPPSPGRTGVGSPPVTAVAASDPSDVGGGALNNDTNHSSSADRALDGSAFDWQRSSNVGQGGYETMVRSLKSHIVDGDIIQAVPSQRITRQIPEGNSTSAFDIYRQLRVVNPSPYMFYLELGEGFQVRAAGAPALGRDDDDDGDRAARVPSSFTLLMSMCPPPFSSSSYLSSRSTCRSWVRHPRCCARWTTRTAPSTRIQSPARGDAAQPQRKTMHWQRIFLRTLRSELSTLCWLTWAATTSAASLSLAPCTWTRSCTSRSTRTSCTSSATSAASWRTTGRPTTHSAAYSPPALFQAPLK